MLLLSVAESLCPPDLMVSGLCTAPWFHPVKVAIFFFSSALTAGTIVMTAYLVAPAHRARTAWGTFAAGGVVALVMGISANAWGELSAAILAGGSTAALLARRGRNSTTRQGTTLGETPPPANG